MKNPLQLILRSVILLLLVEAQGKSETALVVANCRSVWLGPSTGFMPGIGSVTNIFTTYDGSSGIPVHDVVNGTWYFGEELRPRAGSPGIYEADWISYIASGYIEYGSVTLKLPTTDSDGNGLPDISQLNMGVNAAVSGAGTADWTLSGFTGPFSISGNLSRSANSQNGTYSMTVSNSNGSLFYSGTWGVSHVSGSVTYQRATTNTINFNVTAFNPDGNSMSWTGSTTFNVNSTNQVAIPQFYLTGTDSKTLAVYTQTVYAFTLNRTGNKYVGNLSVSDGNLATSWPDYTSWVLEMTDSNDSNANGIPDLSDSLPIPPKITTQPQNNIVNVGANATFTVAASGTSPLRYRWWWVTDAGVTNTYPAWTNSSLALVKVVAANAGTFYAVVTNVAGAAISAPASLTILTPPAIIAQPQSQTVVAGQTASFSVQANGGIPLGYRWRFNVTNTVPSATNAILILSNAQPANAGNYTVVVTNSLGSVTSQVAVLTVHSLPNAALTFPANNSVFSAPAAIQITATASAFDGTIAHVDFYQGATMLGTVTTAPYTMTWPNVPAGTYAFTAEATDNFGAAAMTTPVNVTVKPGECIPPPAGLVAWWPGDGNANDIISNKNWTAFGNTTFVPGKVGEAFSFNGMDAYVARANDVATTAVDNWALAAWVFWKGFVGGPGKQIQVLLYNGNGGANGYGLLIPEPGACPGGLCPEVGNLVAIYGGLAYVPLGISLDQDAWNHIALVRENGVLKLYKNGALVFSNATVAPNPPSPADGYIYVGGGSPNNFNGLLDEVMFFNNSIAEDEVRTLFTADSLGVCKPLVFDRIRTLPDGSVFMSVSGQEGKNITVHASSNLVGWASLATLPNPNGTLQFTNKLSGGLQSQFYRASASTTNLVMISPGAFIMGSPSNELDRFDNEGPQTAVTLTKGFLMGKYLVTQGDYLAVVGENPSYFSTNNGFPLDLSRPVDSVSWTDATNYCARRTQQERAAGVIPLNSFYRLPTEAEFEFACRAGTTTRFSYGDDPNYASLSAYAWYTNDAGLATHAVGEKLPNPWGFYDMHGQVFEWCEDWCGSYPGGSVTNPTGPSSGSIRVSRGGSWLDTAPYCRSARRFGYSSGYSDSRFGFRVVLDPSQP